MAKVNFKNLVATALKDIDGDIKDVANKAIEVAAKAPTVAIPSATIVPVSIKSAGLAAERLSEVAYVAKTMRREIGQDGLLAADTKDLAGRFKAVGVTGDIAELLPTGFTGALWHDIQERLVVTSLFPYKEVSPGQYDSIAVHGITGYLTGENVTATESAEDYLTMIYLVAKCMAAVKKSYEVLDDSLIPLAQEVRNGIIDALARSIEDAVVNGDNTATHMDDGVAANSYKKAYKGLRKLGLGKSPVDFGGAALDEAGMFAKIMELQEAGGLYTDDQTVGRGELVLIVDQNLFNKLRVFTSFLTKDKAGLGTLFGMDIPSVFGIPVVQTPFLPVVNATGVVDAIGANNTKGTCILVNKSTIKYYSTGTPLMESDRDILTQFLSFAGSVRCGFGSIFDRLASAPNDIDATKVNIVSGINIAR